MCQTVKYSFILLCSAEASEEEGKAEFDERQSGELMLEVNCGIIRFESAN